MIGELADLPSHITLTVGDRAEIPLPSYAGSGNSWSVSGDPGQKVADLAVEVEAPAPTPGRGDGVSEPPAMSVASERAVVRALQPGEAIWHLVLARSFGPPEPAATHDVRVTVVPPPAETEGT